MATPTSCSSHTNIPSLSPVWVVGFIGHRRNVDPAKLTPILERELRTLSQKVTALGGSLHFYSSVADGADLLALDCAERIGLPLHVVLPVPEEDFVRPFPRTEDRERALARVKSIREQPSKHSYRLAPTCMRLPDAYFEADTLIVEAADIMMVIWDGQPEEGLGGTAQLVELSKNKNLPLCWIHRDTCEVKKPDIDAVFRPDPVIERFSEMKILRCVAATDASQSEVASALSEIKTRLSALAGSEAHWLRHASTQFLLFNILAAVLGAIGGRLPHTTTSEWLLVLAIGILECTLLGYNLWFKHGKYRKKVRDQWIDARFGSDLYRSLDASRGILDPLRPLFTGEREVSGLKGDFSDWRRFALSVGLHLHASTAQRNWRAMRDTQFSDRISSQINYFTKNGQTKTLLQSVNRALAKPISPIIPVLVMTAVIIRITSLAQGWPEPAKLALALLPAIVPLLITLPSSILASLDLDRRAQRYPNLASKLIRLQAELPSVQTEASLRHFVTRTESMLLTELREWYFATSRTDPG